MRPHFWWEIFDIVGKGAFGIWLIPRVAVFILATNLPPYPAAGLFLAYLIFLWKYFDWIGKWVPEG